VDASDFTEYRPLLFSIAYRMTGSVADAVANPEKLRHLGPVSRTLPLRS
jgi:hypothetical protein